MSNEPGASSSSSSRGGPAEDGAALRERVEQKFESDFLEYDKKKNKAKSYTLGAVGAGIGGAIGFVAAPVLMPGIAVAALVGGAGGYQWAKSWSKQEKRGDAADTSTAASKHLPSMRRLKFMVKWSQWQLHEYQSAPVEARIAVIDEVVRAFSPWVQRTYLLQAKGQAGEDDAEAFEAFHHLAPLFFLLHRKVVVEATISSAVAVGKAFDRGDVDSTCADRARVVFPAILETISVLDRLSPATHSQLLKDTGASTSLKASFNAQRSNRRHRLQLIVTSVRKVLEREDVKKAVADPRLFAHKAPAEAAPAESEEKELAEPPSPTNSETYGSDLKHKLKDLVLPPVGVEDEVLGDLDDEAFLSLSEGSDNEDSAKSARKPPLSPSRSASGNFGKTSEGRNVRVAGIKQRCEAFPKGQGLHTWKLSDHLQYNIRAETYFQDRQKLPGDVPMLEVVYVDWLMVSDSGPVRNVAEHPDFYPRLARSRGDKRFFFISNFTVGCFQTVMTAAINPDAAWLRNPSLPQTSVWNRFLEEDDDGKKGRLKLIVSVDEGPWLVKRAFIKKPVMICKLLKSEFIHKPGDYMEAAFEPEGGPSVSLILQSLKRIAISVCYILEAKEQDELPENLLAAATCSFMDPGKFCLPNDLLAGK